MSGLAQTQSVHAQLTHSETASSYSEHTEILSHEEYPPMPHEAPEEVGAATNSPKAGVQESPVTGGSRRNRRRLTNSTLSDRHHMPRQNHERLILLSVFLTVTLGIYLTKYLSQCVLPPRHAGPSSDATSLGLHRAETRVRLSGPLSTVTGNGRRLAAAERSGGNGEYPDDTGSEEDSKDLFCYSPRVSGGAEGFRLASSGNTGQRDVGPFGGTSSSPRRPASSSLALAVSGDDAQGSVLSSTTSAPSQQIPGSRSAEAQVLRELATKVMSLAAEASSMLSALTHSSTEVRGALVSLTEIYGTLLNSADNVEKGIESEGRDDRITGDKHKSAAGGDRGAAEKDIISLARSGKGTDDTQAVDKQHPGFRQPVLTRLDDWDGNASPLGTIFEVGEYDEQADDDDNFTDASSLFRIGSAAGCDKEKPLSLAQAISVVGIPLGAKDGWTPFSSTTSTSDAWEKFLTQQNDAKEHPGDDADGVAGGQPQRPPYSDVLKHPPRSHSEPPRSRAPTGQGLQKRVAGLGQRQTSSGHRQSAMSRDATGERHHSPGGPRMPGRRPTNRFQSIDRSVKSRREGVSSRLPSTLPMSPLAQKAKPGFGASGTPAQRGASQGGKPSGSEKRDDGEPSKEVKGQSEDSGQAGAGGGALGGAGGGGRRPGDDERDDEKRKKGQGSSSGGGDKKKEEQEKRAKKEKDQREEEKKESKPVDGRETREEKAKHGGGALNGDSGKGSIGEKAGKKKAKKDRARRAGEGVVGGIIDGGVTSEATSGGAKDAESQKDSEDRGVHGGGRGGEGTGSPRVTETGDAVQPDSGGAGSGSEDGDKSRSGAAGLEKQATKRQKSSGGRRKKKGAAIVPQTGETTTGETPQSAVDSEGGSAGKVTASDKNEAGADEGGRDANADEDRQAATAGPRAGAQHRGEHGGENDEVGESVEVAEVDEAGGDAAAQREALRTGARPKTSSAPGRRKQKMREQQVEQAESTATPSSAATDDQAAPSRGRARHRTHGPATRAGRDGGQKCSNASVGPCDGKGGHDGDVTLVLSGKGSNSSVRKGARPGGVDVLSVSLNISLKTTRVIADYRRELESLAVMAGATELLDKAVNDKLSLEEIEAHDFMVLSQAVMLEAEINFRLDSLHEVANGLMDLVTGKKQAATKEESATSAEAMSTTVTESSRGTVDSIRVLEQVLGNIQEASSVSRDRGVALLSTELHLRAEAIEKYVLPELPAIDLPPLPHQSGYDPDSTDVLHTSGGQSLPVAAPSTAVFILKDCLSQWKVTAESGALASLEERWWSPPSDPEEAKRQQERTAAAFQMAASLASLRVLYANSRQWALSHAIRQSDDPRIRQMLQETAGLLAGAIKAEVLASRLAVEDYASLVRATARANVRHPERAWRPLSTNEHAPEIRAAMDASDKEASGAQAPVYEMRPDVLHGTKTHEKHGDDESTM